MLILHETRERRQEPLAERRSIGHRFIHGIAPVIGGIAKFRFNIARFEPKGERRDGLCRLMGGEEGETAQSTERLQTDKFIDNHTGLDVVIHGGIALAVHVQQ